MIYYYDNNETTARREPWEETNVQKGWECPKCKRVNAPWISLCPCYFDKTYTIPLDQRKIHC